MCHLIFRWHIAPVGPESSIFEDFRPKIVKILSLYRYLSDFMVKLAALDLTVKILQKIWKITSPTTIFRPRMAYFWGFWPKIELSLNNGLQKLKKIEK